MEKTIHSKAYKVVRVWLVTMRHERRLTQRDLAVMLGVPHSWVGKIETGERRLDLIEYIRVCKVMDVDPHVGLDACLQQVDS
jgi:transcriptional regulator with XRE-family HTH domain